MDDLEVIRLAVAVIITEKRVARVGMEVKENLKGGGKECDLTPLQVFP
jgi:acyl-CoA synthetase (NDP forming)